MHRSFRAALVALIAAAGLLAVPLAQPGPASALGPLPPCKIADVMTVPHDYDSWATTLVDWTFMVPKNYVPPDLVSVRLAGLTGGGLVRKIAIKDLTAMATAAKKAGYPLGSFSAYRSYSTQKALFNDYSKGYGYKTAITFSARPGHSEHQLGLAIDFSPSGFNGFISGDSGVGRWMAANSWKYGWLLSYPKGKSKVVCYNYEPWHFRYYGRDLAKQIHDSGLTTREYLWSHFTMVDPATGQPLASSSPDASPSAASSTAPGSPSPGASPGPSDAASGVPLTPEPSAPVPSQPPATPAATWFGVDPTLIAAAVLIVLAVAGVLVLRTWRLRRRGPVPGDSPPPQ